MSRSNGIRMKSKPHGIQPIRAPKSMAGPPYDPMTPPIKKKRGGNADAYNTVNLVNNAPTGTM